VPPDTYLRNQLPRHAVRLILALPLFVLHQPRCSVSVFSSNDPSQCPIRSIQAKRHIKRRRRNFQNNSSGACSFVPFKSVAPILPSRRCTGPSMFASAEHVNAQTNGANPVFPGFSFSTDVIHVLPPDRRLVIFMHDHVKQLSEHEFLIRNVTSLCANAHCTRETTHCIHLNFHSASDIFC